MPDNIGGGQLGLLSGLRLHAELVEASVAERNIVVVAYPKVTVTGWTVHSGSIYKATYSRPFYRYGEPAGANDFFRDVIGVTTGSAGSLSRSETLAGMVAGTFFYDPAIAAPILYVWLSTGGNPSSTTVVALLGFWFGTKGIVIPQLGGDKLANDGSFETWGGGLPNGWTLSGTAGHITEETANVPEGAKALNIDGGSTTFLYRAFTAAAGEVYLLSGSYYTAPGGVAGPVIAISDGSAGVLSDGRDTATGATLQLALTEGETRTFAFYFIAPAASGWRVQLGGVSASETVFDKVRLQRVERWNYAEPRLSSVSIPEFEMGLNDILFGGGRISAGTVTLLNGDGALESDLGDLIWINAEAHVLFGGTFADGQAVQFFDYRYGFPGRVGRPGVDDQKITLPLTDVRSFYNFRIPPTTYPTTLTNPDPEVVGKYRPVLFGAKTNITPPRIGKSGDYGIYEIADTSKAPNGIVAISALYAYENAEAAAAKDTTRRLTLVTADRTLDLTNGQFTLARDVGPYRIDDTNCALDFFTGTVGNAVAILVKGLYSATALASEIQTRIAALDALCTCTYSNSTHKFTLARSVAAFSLLIQSGANAHIGVWRTIGHNTSADKTGAISYVGDTATFIDPDKDHIIRADASGYKDDASGTYTGGGSSLIQKGPDIVKFILARFLAADSVNAASIVAARINTPQPLGIYIKDQTTLRQVFDQIEHSDLMTINVESDGVIYFDVYTTSPAVVVALEERGLIGFECGKEAEDVLGTVIVTYDQDPTTGAFQSVSKEDGTVSVKYGRADSRTFQTFLTVQADAITVAAALGLLFGTPGRRIEATVPGKLVSRRPAQAVTVTRARSMGPALAATTFRILSLKHNLYSNRTRAVLLEKVV